MIDLTTMLRGQARELTERAIATLNDAYRATLHQGPAATVAASIAAQGEDWTRYAIFTIINYHGDDKRISARNKARAATLWTWGLPAGNKIPSAHLNEIADALPD